MRKQNNLRSTNLNLLPILAELLTRRNVTDTAKALNLTQSAVSASLKRLRAMFDDDLLVPYGRGLSLTEKAQKLQPGLNEIIKSLYAFLGDAPFDPSIDSHVFRIVTADYVTTFLGPYFGELLQKNTPNIRFQVSAEATFADRQLRLGNLDLVIAPERIRRWTALDFSDPHSEFASEPCFTDHLVAIRRADASNQDLDLETYLSLPHVTFCLRDGLHASLEQETLTTLGFTQNDIILVPEFSLLPLMVVENNTISVIPASLARRYSKIYPISIFTPPIEFPKVELVMIWSKSRNRDSALTWFRSQVLKGFSLIQE